MEIKFANLYDFLNYVEFCPLCGSRTMASIISPIANVCKLEGQRIVLAGQEDFTINLLDNSVSNNYIYSECKDVENILLNKQCSKYHFFYSGSANIHKNTLAVKDIILHRYHIIRIIKSSHFTINENFNEDITNIRITENMQTRELSLPLINFVSYTRKKIDNKLENIRLLE